MQGIRRSSFAVILLLTVFYAFSPVMLRTHGCAEEHYSENNTGLSFSSLKHVVDHYDHQGYLLLGRFESAQWPATIVYEKDDLNEISFVLKNGSPHSYPGYTGYRLKAVALEDESGEEIMLVFRSKARVESR